jgi:hypothetical protein
VTVKCLIDICKHSNLSRFNIHILIHILNKKFFYQTVGTVPKSNLKIVDAEAKLISLANMYMTAHFPGLKSGWIFNFMFKFLKYL